MVKGHPRIIIGKKHVKLWGPIAINTKIQSQNFLSSGEDFQVFILPHMGIVGIFISGVDPCQQTAFYRRLHVKAGEKWSNSFREDVYRLHYFKHIPTGRDCEGLQLQGDKILIVTNKLYNFNHTLQISAISL